MTREEVIKEYQELGSAAMAVSIYDIGMKINETLGNGIFRFNNIISQFTCDMNEKTNRVVNELTNSYNGLFLHAKNWLQK